MRNAAEVDDTKMETTMTRSAILGSLIDLRHLNLHKASNVFNIKLFQRLQKIKMYWS